MKKAFTLAEIMIVLSVIAVLTAILLPAARNAMPNEDVLKFKKNHSVFTTAIRELVNSDKYYLDGDFTKKPDGSKPDCCYHAHALADVMNAQVISCDNTNPTGYECVNTPELIEEFKSIDTNYGGLAGYLMSTVMGYGCNNQIRLQNSSILLYSPPLVNDSVCVDENGFNAAFGRAAFATTNNIDFNNDGNISSSDVSFAFDSCVVKGECYGAKSYLIRSDGKIINSHEVDEWLERDIQDKD